MEESISFYSSPFTLSPLPLPFPFSFLCVSVSLWLIFCSLREMGFLDLQDYGNAAIVRVPPNSITE
jgi:hypothetical protein